MTVEAATYIYQLNSSLPTGADALAEGDNHLRLIKQVLLNTFPNLAGAVTVSHADLNSVVGKVDRAGDIMTGALTVPRLRIDSPDGVQAPVLDLRDDTATVKGQVVYRLDTGAVEIRRWIDVTTWDTLELSSTGLKWNGATVWHSGNDGPGSGLNADLVDGYNANTGAVASTVAARTATGELYATRLYGTDGGAALSGTSGYILDITQPNAIPWALRILNSTFGGGGFRAYQLDTGELDLVLYDATSTIVGKWRFGQDGVLRAAVGAIHANDAERLTTARTITITGSGDVTGSGSGVFDGSADITINLPLSVVGGTTVDAASRLDPGRFIGVSLSGDTVGSGSVFFDGTTDVTISVSTTVGRADQAGRLSTARTISVSASGDATGSGSVSFDGTADAPINIPLTVNQAANANTLNGAGPDTSATVSTIAQRDSAGGLRATAFLAQAGAGSSATSAWYPDGSAFAYAYLTVDAQGTVRLYSRGQASGDQGELRLPGSGGVELYQAGTLLMDWDLTNTRWRDRYERVYYDGVTTFRYWHEGNDGAGSGLDADLLDGRQSDTGTTANTIPVRDASGNLPGNVTGSAAKLTTGRSIGVSIGGDATGSASAIFDGSADITIGPNITVNQLKGGGFRQDASGTWLADNTVARDVGGAFMAYLARPAEVYEWFTPGTYTWSPPSGAIAMLITVVGAGGGGSGATASSTSYGTNVVCVPGLPGGRGGALYAYVSPFGMTGAPYTITVGAGGAAGTSGTSPTSGGSGGASTIKDAAGNTLAYAGGGYGGSNLSTSYQVYCGASSLNWGNAVLLQATAGVYANVATGVALAPTAAPPKNYYITNPGPIQPPIQLGLAGTGGKGGIIYLSTTMSFYDGTAGNDGAVRIEVFY